MPEALVAIPVKLSTATHSYTFKDGISIREISPLLWDTARRKSFISDDEWDTLKITHYWLCASKNVDDVDGGTCADLYDKAMYAAWALQIICPSGGTNVFLLLKHTQQGYEIVDSKPRKGLCSTLFG
ncbi:MAG: hypothetical protein ACRD9L_13330, partial [Bryobacteraceae bacterium]